jgi:TPR repeat protein
MKEACDEDADSAACTFAALIIGAKTGKNTHPDDKAQATAMLSLMSTGCEWGNAFACNFIVGAYGEAYFEEMGIGADGDKLEEIVGEGCGSGSASACMQLGEFFFSGTMLAMGDTEVAADYTKSAKYVSKACYGGVGEACLWSAMMYGANNVNSCAALFDKHVKESDKEVDDYLSLVWPSLTGKPRAESIKKFCQNTAAIYNAQKAYDLADKACYMSGGDLIKQSCALSASLKP